MLNLLLQFHPLESYRQRVKNEPMFKKGPNRQIALVRVQVSLLSTKFVNLNDQDSIGSLLSRIISPIESVLRANLVAFLCIHTLLNVIIEVCRNLAFQFLTT